MGIRIISNTEIFTVEDLSQFLYHVDNIYKAVVFQIQKKNYDTFNFYKMNLIDSESLVVGPISKHSPLDIIFIPTVTIGGLAGIIFGIFNIVIKIHSMFKNKNNKYNTEDKKERIQIIKEELERTNIIQHDDIIEKETLKLSYSKITIDSINIEDKTFSDYFKKDNK